MSTLFELSQSEVKRYSRQLSLPGFGLEAQSKLKRARILVVGVGGLGCPVLLYLAASGVGTLGIIDGGEVQEADLQRQILFGAHSIGKRKVPEARERMWELNPLINIEAYPFRLMADNAEGIIKNYDLVIDGGGNLATRYLINDACVVLDRPFVAASISRFEGLLGVFNGLWGGIRGPTYRCLFPEPLAAAEFQRAAGEGVLGAAAGVLGSLQAIEALKIISGIGTPLFGELLKIDLLSLQIERMYFHRDERIAQATRILHDGEYAVQCGGAVSSTVREMSVTELHQKLEKGEQVHLIDVREPFERDISSIGGTLIPMAQLESRLDQIPRDGTVVVYCRSGGRSRRAIEELQRSHGFTNLVNLRGGILAWSDEINPELPKY